MSGTIEQEKLKNTAKVQRRIYFAFAASVLTYLLILLLITSSHSPTGKNTNTVAITIRYVFIGLSVLAAATKFWIQFSRLDKARYYEKYETLDEIIKKYMQRFCIILTLCITPAVSGLVLVFCTMRLSEYWPFMAASLILFATSYPRREGIQDIVEKNPARSRLDPDTFVGEIKTEADFVEEAVGEAGEAAIPSVSRRVFAFLIDVLLVFGACLLMLKMPTIEKYEIPQLFRHANTLTYLFLVIYQLFAIRFFGKTIGCSTCGLQIRSITGIRPDLIRSSIRGFVQLWMVFGFFPLFLLIESVIFLIQSRRGKNPYKRTTWDKAAATVVVRAI